MMRRPRREWKSFLCSLRCSVRFLMRSDNTATWTSGDPVSPSLVAYSLISSCLRSCVIDTGFSIFMCMNDTHGLQPVVFHPRDRNHPLAAHRPDNGRGGGFGTGRALQQRQKRQSLSVRQVAGLLFRQGQGRDVVQRGSKRNAEGPRTAHYARGAIVYPEKSPRPREKGPQRVRRSAATCPTVPRAAARSRAIERM